MPCAETGLVQMATDIMRRDRDDFILFLGIR
jgi:hypothetical protein